MIELYQATAQFYAEQIDTLLSSEKMLEDFFKTLYPGLPFDRTEHWAHVFETLLNEAWFEKGPIVKGNPTALDRLHIIRALHPLLDYNLFTQVLLNLQGYTGMFYMPGDAQKEIDRLKEYWKTRQWKSDPFAPKAKMAKRSVILTDEENEFNNVISTMRALRIITQFTPQISFRVSPKGSTPAFADSRNISMIGIGGDKFLRTIPELKAFYITWDQVPQMARLCEHQPHKEGICFSADGIPYEFVSKSGGGILQEVLFARKLMYEIFGSVDTTKETCIMVPRMNSLLVVTSAGGASLLTAFELVRTKYPMLSLIEGFRA